jgi:glycosyltransferase involved in cell wall biosynthesis
VTCLLLIASRFLVWVFLMLSVLIPSWNNLDYLQLCVRSLLENSQVPLQIIVHVNDGSDGSLAWVQGSGLLYTHTPLNVGICLAVNRAAMLASSEYIVYLNDDMYCLPGWDTALVRRIQMLPTSLFLISGTMVEPKASGNRCVIARDYGDTVANFRECDLLRDQASLQKSDWYGATWPPTVVHRDWWFQVGGYSSELSPGMASDNDFSMKLWHAGCRHFVGVGDSLVYHFQCKSTGKVVKNDGRRQFLNKWGITTSTFDHHYLRRGELLGELVLPEPDPAQQTGLAWALRKSALKRRFGW